MRRSLALCTLGAAVFGVGYFSLNWTGFFRDAHTIANERTMAKQSPVLGLPGTDPDALARALGELARVRDRLAKMQTSDDDAKRVQFALYPLGFLTALTDLERARLAFIASGTDPDAVAYRRAMRRAISAYRNDLAAFRAAFKKTVPHTVPPYIAESGGTDRASIENAIAALESRALELRRIVRARDACARGAESGCAASRIDIADDPAQARTDPGPSGAFIRTLYAEASPMYEILPRVAATDEACMRSGDGAALITYAMGGEMHAKPIMLDGIRLVDSEKTRSIPFYRYFADRGVRYVPSPPLTHYSCPEFAEMFSTLLAETYATSTPYMTQEKALRSTRFDEIVTFIAYMEDAIYNAAQNGAPGSFDAATLFYVRSGFLALFLGHMPLAGNTVDLVHTQPPTRQPFIFYDRASDIAREEILSGLRAFENVHLPPVDE